jgi:transcription-repair coupling factor (superfamily II helicase)
MELLRRLGEARGDQAVEQLLAEMRDRYGRPPEPLANLVDLFRLKEMCRRLGISRVFHPGSGEVLLFVRDYARFGRLRLRRGEGRHVEGSRVLVVLPPEVRTPGELLGYLLEEFRERAPTPEAGARRA